MSIAHAALLAPERAMRSSSNLRPESVAPRRTVDVEALATAEDEPFEPELGAALVGLMREQRLSRVGELCEGARDQGGDPVVCDFLADDLRQATHLMGDLEGWLQESFEVLERPEAATLIGQAVDASALHSLERLTGVVENLRRRLLQTAVGVRSQQR